MRCKDCGSRLTQEDVIFATLDGDKPDTCIDCLAGEECDKCEGYHPAELPCVAMTAAAEDRLTYDRRA